MTTRRDRRVPLRWCGLVVLAMCAAPCAAQTSPIGRARAAHLEFLRRFPLSPFAALAQQPLGDSLAIGPAEADIPVRGAARILVTRRAATAVVTLADGTTRALGRQAPVQIGDVQLVLRGLRERPVLAVYGTVAAGAGARWYPESAAAVQVVTLAPPATARRQPALAFDGAETMASDAGTVTLASGETLQVRRYETGDDEAELEIFFRDPTNGRETYPAGRFVALQPLGGGRYRLDFNRARNPFCAYNTIFPCPPPWPRNVLARPMRAGERYDAK